MARLLLVPLALLLFLAALPPLAAAMLAGGQGMAAALADPGLPQATRGALQSALAIAVISLPVGLAMAMALWQAPRFARGLALAFCWLVLLAPAPGFRLLLVWTSMPPAAWLAFLGAVARGTALATLILSAGLAGLPRGLPRAARAAGARPMQAWLHAVIAPLKWPILGSAAAAFLAGFAAGPGGALLARHMDMAEAWVAPAALLFAACGLAAITVLLRPSAT